MTGNMPVIIAIDDDQITLDILEEQLSGKGYRITTESAAARGIELARSFSPDLILLDINMPGMNGFEVMERLKADDITRDIPVIMLTAINQKKTFVDAVKYGVIDYIIKPYEPERLFIKIEAALNYSNLHKSAKEQESEYIHLNRQDDIFVFTFQKNIGEKYFFEEAKKVFNTFLVRQLSGKYPVFDLRIVEDISEDEIILLKEIIMTLKHKDLSIVAGRNYGSLVTYGDVENYASLFISFGDFEIFIRKKMLENL